LLFSAGGSEPRACPLSLVTRLEDLDASTIEMTSRGPVVQYRGRLMPLAPAGGMVRHDGRQPVLVFSQGSVVVGLAVDAILDIVEEPALKLTADSKGYVHGMVVSNEHAADLPSDMYVFDALRRRAIAADIAGTCSYEAMNSVGGPGAVGPHRRTMPSWLRPLGTWPHHQIPGRSGERT
jgi:hypothetical protein